MPDPSSRRQWVLTLLERHELPLTRYATRLMGDGDLAREAVQHVFLQLCEQTAEKLAGREPAWLFRVCRNKALDLIRLRQRLEGDSELAEIPSREPDPAEWVERQDTCVELSRLVAQLPDSQREAIDLWCEGFTYRQISEIAGQSEGNVRVLVHRAIKQLRKVMKVET